MFVLNAPTLSRILLTKTSKKQECRQSQFSPLKGGLNGEQADKKKRFFFRLLGGPWPSLPAEPKKGRNTGLSLHPLEFCDIIQGNMGP
jgi:hypothetical protein